VSKSKYFGTRLDQIFKGTQRHPDFKFFIWNPNRTTINDVTLGRALSPRYDITQWVISADYSENICWENNDDGSASNVRVEVLYDPTGSPIQITEKTLLDNTPFQIWCGDERLPLREWMPLFTGVIRGTPGFTEMSRRPQNVQTMTVTVVGREEAFLNSVVTARAYEKGTDIGRVVVETAIECMHLNRREIEIGDQNYVIGHATAQLVDIEVMKGIYQILFCTGKKPKFNYEGKLVAADTNLSKPVTRSYLDYDLVQEIRRVQGGRSMNNSVRLLGLDDDMTEILERRKKLAHGHITAGFFCPNVHMHVDFSKVGGKAEGGQKAIDTEMKYKVNGMGSFTHEHADWVPELEEDGRTCFGGVIQFNTGFDQGLMVAITVGYSVTALAAGAALCFSL